jgi:release factor glutamine methyltransferase
VNAREAASKAAARLAAAGVSDAAFEAELLTRESAGVTRAGFFAGAEIDEGAGMRLETFVERRATREPAAYITGHREFFGRDFAVGPGVLIPRPETELLVELALKELDADPTAIVVEVGTGSGAVAVSVAAELPQSAVIATEISPEAMAFARLNAERHRAGVRFVRADLASALARADVVLANLPYIPSWEIEALEPEVSKYEPLVALDGGVDGFVLIRRLIADCADRLRPRLIALEVAFGQAKDVEAILRIYGVEPWSKKDLSGIDRIVCARWR